MLRLLDIWAFIFVVVNTLKESKGAFYRAVNALCSKTKYKPDDMVLLHLVTSFCRPLLLRMF